MKKTSIVLLALATAGLAASCQKEETVEQGFTPMTINAVSEGIVTKTEMIYKYDIAWSANDKIYVTDGTSNDTFTLSDGEGTTKGTFKQDGDVTLTGEVQAYYPATMLEGGSPVWPASQTNDQTIPMYCKKTLSGAAEERMDFSSLGSVLQIVFNTTQENVTLKSIEIKDGSATLSGAFTVDTDGKAVITASDKAGITLDLGAGVALGKAANYFNIAVPAGNYQDLTLVFTATNGTKCTMTKGKVNIAYNAVGRLTLMGEKFKADVPDGALPGVFTVADDGQGNVKKVHFSQGNLTYNVSTTTWAFYEHQYDCATGYDSNLISLFTWGYGTWSTSPNGTGCQTGDFTDWGSQIGDGNTWRTLSAAEWRYLFNDGDYTSDVRNGKYKWATVNGVGGYVIAPDDFTGTLQETYADDAALAANNLVFLPAASIRDRSIVGDVGNSGYYWSSTAYDERDAFLVYFDCFYVSPDPGYRDYRDYGLSVRLITECQRESRAE